VLGVAAKLIERLGLEIAKNRMIAQDRQRAARHRSRRNIFVLGHAGHNHLMICAVRHPRDHAEWLMIILYQPPALYAGIVRTARNDWIIRDVSTSCQ
jgi:hypothetical protein